MGGHGHHTAQKGDAFCVPEMKWFWRDVQIYSKTKAKDLVKMSALTKKRVSLYTAKHLVCQHELKCQEGRESHCSKTFIMSQITVGSCTGRQKIFLEAHPLADDQN